MGKSGQSIKIGPTVGASWSGTHVRTSYGSVCFRDDLFWREDARKRTRYGSAFGRTLVKLRLSKERREVDLQGHSDAQVRKEEHLESSHGPLHTLIAVNRNTARI
ncbi:hypothetical protein PIB30_050932 [Stylosanthes scabra]|uniref:Uncharacterized protein n=1 Tax=Stylosanthes scabra TaxID=79078 RepID=A0ABU6RIF1_9FABA|nr:hypothetical protein [Stylosanthes scabra]